MKGKAGAAIVFLLSSAVIGMVFLAPPKWLAIPIAGMAAGLYLSRRSPGWPDLIAPAAMTFLSCYVFVSDSLRAAMAYPVVVNFGLLAYFWSTLRGGQTAIERLARLEEPELPPEGVRYTRMLTKVWCGFFLANGAFAAFTAWLGDSVLWAAYNGGISYALIGALVLGERMFRPWLTRRMLMNPGGAHVPTARLLGEGRSDASIVCHLGGNPVQLGRFRADVIAKASRVGAHPADEWIVDSKDGYQFAVDLLAVVLSGRHALIPRNHQPATLVDMRSLYPQSVGCADIGSGWPAVEWVPAEGGRVSFLTSGSTGEPKAVMRAWTALLAEAEMLEGLFGARITGTQVLGTVPHHFIYGAIFRIIWPLWAGRVFDADPLPDGYAVLAKLKSGGEYVLVSSPSLLERMPAEHMDAFGGLRTVFSSGSLLRPDVAARWSSPCEIYGSTETGGVAWRQQFLGGEAWQALPGVTVSSRADGVLRVISPFVASGGETTADSVRMVADGRFELLGRTDRIAKVEGRRVSLPELESVAEGHPSVMACRLFQPEDASRLVAIVVPRLDIPEADYRLLVEELRAKMLRTHDSVVTPRRWKILPGMPADGRGKASLESLRAVFAPAGRSFSPASCLPQLLGHRRNKEGEISLSLLVPEDLPLFDGHFPGMPILPGVALVDWAAKLAEAYLGVPSAFDVVDNLKFNAAVYPGEMLKLSLNVVPAGLSFRFDGPAGLKSSGALLRNVNPHA